MMTHLLNDSSQYCPLALMKERIERANTPSSNNAEMEMTNKKLNEAKENREIKLKLKNEADIHANTGKYNLNMSHHYESSLQ